MVGSDRAGGWCGGVVGATTGVEVGTSVRNSTTRVVLLLEGRAPYPPTMVEVSLVASIVGGTGGGRCDEEPGRPLPGRLVNDPPEAVAAAAANPCVTLPAETEDGDDDDDDVVGSGSVDGGDNGRCCSNGSSSGRNFRYSLLMKRRAVMNSSHSSDACAAAHWLGSFSTAAVATEVDECESNWEEGSGFVDDDTPAPPKKDDGMPVGMGTRAQVATADTEGRRRALADPARVVVGRFPVAAVGYSGGVVNIRDLRP